MYMFTIPKNWNMFTICYVFLFYFTALGGGYKKDGNRTGSVQRWGVYSASSRTQTFHVIFIWKKVNLFFFHVGQLSDILRLKQETGHMNTILTQLSSFVKSIASVTERLAPKYDSASILFMTWFENPGLCVTKEN